MRPPAGAWFGAIALAVVAGCFQPSPQEGLACSPAGECPAGLRCIDMVCVSGGTAVDAPPLGSPDGDPPDAVCGACSDPNTFQPCAGTAITCDLGCVSGGGDHCAQVVPANEVAASLAGNVGADTVLTTGTATFDTETGAISGAITRAAGTGVATNIGYYPHSSGGVSIGVFVFAGLNVGAAATFHFTGSRAVVLLAGGAIVVDGVIDASGGCYGSDLACPGPGGGAGATGLGSPASGCGAGGTGSPGTSNVDDSGGGGGGGSSAGRAGGATPEPVAGGAAGGSCVPATVIPLHGGGGGGGGSTGATAFPGGGGGGGAIQLTSLSQITIRGQILAGGSGGSGGLASGSGNASAGAGGGAGGGILLESIVVTVVGSATIAANGGGGGGGGNSGTAGEPGEAGHADTMPAQGGLGHATPGPGSGGDGGTGASTPAPGGNGTNAGGGGAAAGAISVRAQSSNLGGVFSPAAGSQSIVIQ